MRDEVITLKLCPWCGTSDTHEGCAVCAGRGYLDAAASVRHASPKPARRTSTGIVIADILALLVERLRARGTPTALRLADEGQDILTGIMQHPKPGPERNAAYVPAGAWQRLAEELLKP